MQDADRRTIANGLAGFSLMEAAGRAVADAACGLIPFHGRALVLCGPGNNGGDGFVAARLLAERGYTVSLVLAGAADALRGDAAIAAAQWRGGVLPLADAAPEQVDVIIDALFGAGLARDLDGALAELIARVNRAGIPIVAVDVPSGVDGDSGQVRGVAVKATRTVTFFRRKPGHLLMPGRALCGDVIVADIGIADAVLGETGIAAHDNCPEVWRGAFPALRQDGHKYHRGHVLVAAGGLEGVGAPRLSARAALRIGTGLVTVAAEPDALAAHASRGPDALMLRTSAGAAGLAALLADTRRNVCIIGPALGLDGQARHKIHAALRAGAACVLDADALTLLSGHAGALARAAARKPVVITPHEGEFSRLFNISESADGADHPDTMIQDAHGKDLKSDSKLLRAKAAAAITKAVVVLKGADTVIAAPDGRAAINSNAPPWVATAGAGDVLAGLAGGLLAQGMPAFEAACAAVWIHGATAAQLKRGMIADDLIDHLVWPSGVA